MSVTVRRRIFQRVVIFNPASGTILDLPTRHLLAFGGPEESEEYSQTADGSVRPVRRSNAAEIPVIRDKIARFGREIQKISCPVKCLFLGVENSDMWVWAEPTRLQVTDPSVSGGLNAERVFRLESNVFYSAIWEETDLVGGVPWRDTEQKTRNSTNVLRPKSGIRAGYEGPLWEVPSGASVDLVGRPSGIDSTNPATIQFEVPVWGATVRILDREGGLTGTVEAKDWDENNLAGPSAEIVLPNKTWYVEAVVENSARPPIVEIEPGGDPNGVLEGASSPDCTRVTSPTWNDTSVVLTDENV